MKISSLISKKVLTIGLEHNPYKGGIGYLINIYSKYFPTFKYVTTYKILSNKFYLFLFFTKQYIKFLRILIIDKEIEIIHIHGASYGSFYRKFSIFLASKYIFRRRVIYHMNGSEFKIFFEDGNNFRKNLVSFMLERVDVLLCVSKSWKEFFNVNFKIKQIQILENIVSNPQVTKSTLDHKGQVYPLKILFLGLIGDRKGVFDLLDVLHIHKNNFLGRIQLTIGGNGEGERLQQYISKYSLEDIVSFEGWVTGEHKSRLLAESDIYILPSYNEGLPLAILEAMSYGLPIISTFVGGTPEVVHEGINGFLIRPGDKEAIYNCLERFIEDTSLLTRMGSSSFEMVKPYYSNNVIPKLLKIYESLL